MSFLIRSLILAAFLCAMIALLILLWEIGVVK